MNRRTFILLSTISYGTLSQLYSKAEATLISEPENCVPSLDFTTAEATYFARYEHYHLLSIPNSVLINPPTDGYVTRTTTLDQGSLDEKAFAEFIKESKLNGSSLRKHSHEVKFTQNELERIASGEKNVEIIVKTPKGNLGHKFYFTASSSALVKIRRGQV